MKYTLLLLITSICTLLSGQTIVGQWETFDDKTNEKKSVIEIYESEGLYFAKVIEAFTGDINAICEECKGSNKGKTIAELLIIEDLKKDGNKYNGGTILDPESGETYKCKLELESDNKLKVRGFLGFSLFGRTQYWFKK